ncbi:MAG: hypothetical protein KAS32_04035 [Candidatus Peribacteraceae bacterium]|nr:hypothetical protein [Candidatus Peribacteraceae bacterium]
MIPKFLEELNPEVYLSDNYLVLDFETTNIEKGNARIPENSVLLSVWSQAGKQKVKWGSEYQLNELISDIERADFIVAHNAKFELQWLVRCGLDLTTVLVYDTLLGEYVLNGNRRSRLDLSSVAKNYGLGSKESFVDLMIKRGICPSEIPKRFLEKYCRKDVSLTEQIFLKQRQRLLENNLLPVQFTRCIFTPVLADIEVNGMFLDHVRVKETYNKYMSDKKELQSQFDELTGGINVKSPIQVAEYVYGELGFAELRDRQGTPLRNKPSKRFPDGAPRTDKETLLSLKATNKKQATFIDLKKRLGKLNKAIDTYLKLFKEASDNNESMLYGKFNQSVTQTHRLSSSKPNFQNFDRTLKPLFSTRNNKWRIGERDAAQLEFRVAAFLGQDGQAINDISEGFDVHNYTSSIIGCSRQDAKPRTFKPLYGGSSGTPKEKKYYKAFKEKYKAVTETQEEWKLSVLKNKKLITATGLIFYWPDCKMSATGYIEYTPSICNYPVQSLATADIIPIAVTYMWYKMKSEGLESFIVNTVHDSVITEENPEETEMINKLSEEAFTTDVYNYLDKVYGIDFNVPLAIDTIITTHWGQK